MTLNNIHFNHRIMKNISCDRNNDLKKKQSLDLYQACQ